MAVPDRLHRVSFVMHKGCEGLYDSHEPRKGILVPMQCPDRLSSIAENEDMLCVLPPQL